jgi:hypothetical protein
MAARQELQAVVALEIFREPGMAFGIFAPMQKLQLLGHDSEQKTQISEKASHGGASIFMICFAAE